MNKNSVKKWAIDFGFDLNTKKLREIYSPPTRYRISEEIFPINEVVNGTMRPGKCFVISGECIHEFTDQTITLKKGDYVDLPGGDYRLTISNKKETKFVYVWEIV